MRGAGYKGEVFAAVPRASAPAGRYWIHTFGCQMNQHDSERMEVMLRESGYAPASDADADVIVVNTCSVRAKAEHKLLSYLGRIRPLKEARPHATLVVAGCLAQQEGERLLRNAPYIDLIIGPDNIAELPALLRDRASGGTPTVRTEFDYDDPRFLAFQLQQGVETLPGARPVTAYVTTMKGCDERCTFCIVPYTRGSERYRPAADIVAEVKARVDAGVREVTLLGQTVNSWYDPERPRERPPISEFADLLRTLAAEVPALARLRYTSPHPRHVTPALVAAHAELSVLPAHVHLPVQSGSNRVLRRMLRRYTREEYIERAQALAGGRPGLTLSTDIIVGFPGETEEDFLATLDLVRTVGFVAAFAFKYSPRPHTPALRLGDDVPESTKDERLTRLFEVVDQQQSAHLQQLVGTTQQVLVEGPGRGARAMYTGRSARNEIVHFAVPDGRDPTGVVVEVQVERALRHSLTGSWVRADDGGPDDSGFRADAPRRVRLPVRV